MVATLSIYNNSTFSFCFTFFRRDVMALWTKTYEIMQHYFSVKSESMLVNVTQNKCITGIIHWKIKMVYQTEISPQATFLYCAQRLNSQENQQTCRWNICNKIWMVIWIFSKRNHVQVVFHSHFRHYNYACLIGLFNMSYHVHKQYWQLFELICLCCVCVSTIKSWLAVKGTTGKAGLNCFLQCKHDSSSVALV